MQVEQVIREKLSQRKATEAINFYNLLKSVGYKNLLQRVRDGKYNNYVFSRNMKRLLDCGLSRSYLVSL